jgi:hypothetical protein
MCTVAWAQSDDGYSTEFPVITDGDPNNTPGVGNLSVVVNNSSHSTTTSISTTAATTRTTKLAHIREGPSDEDIVLVFMLTCTAVVVVGLTVAAIFYFMRTKARKGKVQYIQMHELRLH